MSETKTMQGKRVLVTGAGTGIGRGVAKEFAKEGACVAIHYASSKEGAKAVVDDIRSAGGMAEAFHADFDDLPQVRSMTENAIDFLGGMDVLVNNAGFVTNVPFEDLKPELWDKLFHINVRSMFFVSQAAVKPMLKQGSGAVINLSSIQAFRGLSQLSVYASTKAAIVGFTRTLAVELAPKGIRVNAIAPGLVVTDNFCKNMPDFDEEAVAKRMIPAGFVGRPADIGRIAVFLASDDARYIVGQTIIADGGRSARVPFGDDAEQPYGCTFGETYTPWLRDIMEKKGSCL